MKKYISTFIKSLIAGILIALGGVTILSLVSSEGYIGKLLFGLVFLIVFIFELDLFNNRLSDVFDSKPIFIVDLVIMLVGNILGAFCTGKLLLLTSYGYFYNSFAEHMNMMKFTNTYIGTFFLAVFCGMLMYFAYVGFKKAPNYLIKTLVVIFCSSAFLFCKFDHAILDVFFFTIGKCWSVEAGIITLCTIAGNIVGTIFIAGLVKITNILTVKKTEKIEE
jgi:formate/nitrite transporter FocA (FNT family)